MTIYIIQSGFVHCADCDKIHGYLPTLGEAQAAVEELNAIGHLEGEDFFYFIEEAEPFGSEQIQELRKARAEQKAEAAKRRQEILDAPPEHIKPPTDYMRQLAADSPS